MRPPGCASRDPRRRVNAPVHSNTSSTPKILPRELRRVTDAQGPQLAAGDDQAASVDDHGLRVPPVHRVEAKQVGEVFDVGQVIDRDELD